MCLVDFRHHSNARTWAQLKIMWALGLVTQYAVHAGLQGAPVSQSGTRIGVLALQP